MKPLKALPPLLAIGLLVQIALGEMGLAARALRDLHAAIGLAGVVLTAYALLAARGVRASLLYLTALFILVLIQSILGLVLFGIFRVDLELFELVEMIHRYNAYLMLVVGLVGGMAVAVVRRRVSSADTVAKSG
jgi:heme A synthase